MMSNFISAFDASKIEHVGWLKRMNTIAENLGPEQKINLIAEINRNPIGAKLDQKDALEWPHIHMCLCAVYARAVLNGKAYIPNNSSSLSL